MNDEVINDSERTAKNTVWQTPPHPTESGQQHTTETLQKTPS
jgi:hypothetical protein